MSLEIGMIVAHKSDENIKHRWLGAHLWEKGEQKYFLMLENEKRGERSHGGFQFDSDKALVFSAHRVNNNGITEHNVFNCVIEGKHLTKAKMRRAAKKFIDSLNEFASEKIDISCF